MKVKKMLKHIMTLSIAIPVLSGCSIVHVHNYDSVYQYNEVKHWQVCETCHEVLNEDSHAFNSFNDTCLICGYVDPTFVVDDDGLMTGLTNYGKTKYELDIPSNVKFITKDALKGSNVTRVNIPKEFVGYYEGAFDYNNINVVTDEEKVVWTLENGIYYKHNVLEEFDAMIGDKYFKTLKEAFDSVKNDGTTITLTKKDLVVNESLRVNRIVSLNSYYETSNLECNFQVGGSGILKIESSVNFKGSAQLLLVHSYEQSNKSWEQVLKSGAITFIDKDTKPADVYVEYVDNYMQGVGVGYEAVGSKQIANDLLLIPVTQYAYGAFAFSYDFKTIKGLSPYGETLSELHITNVVKNINANIASYAFAIYTDVKINIAVIDDTHITYYQTKGIFTSLCVDKGIKSIGDHAFTNETTDDIFHEVKKMIAILSRIQSVYIGESVTYIGGAAFASCLSIQDVYGGRGLVEIADYAFYECINLKSVDFAEAFSIQKIGKYAFANEDCLVQLELPGDNWNVNGKTFAAHQFSGAVAAYHANIDEHDQKVVWTRTINGNICYTASLATDACGKFSNVAYTYDIQAALTNCCDSGWIYILNADKEETKHITSVAIAKSVNIVAYESAGEVTIGSEEAGITILNNRFLTLENIKPLGEVRLNCTIAHHEKYVDFGEHDDGSQFVGDIATFGLRAQDKETYFDTPVYFRDPSTDEKVPARGASAAFKDGIEYLTYGLFVFTYFNEKASEEPNRILFGSTSSLFSSITSVTFDNPLGESEDYNVKKVGLSNDLFEKHPLSIRFVSMADIITGIGVNVFDLCLNLERVTLGKNVEHILSEAFRNCMKLKRVDLGPGSALTEIDEDAFKNCAALEYFDFNGNIGDWTVYSDDSFSTKIVELTSDQLANPYDAAELVKQYSQYAWHKNAEEE